MQNTAITEVQRMDSVWPLVALALPLAINWVLYFVFFEKDLTTFFVTMTTSGILAGLLRIIRLTASWDGQYFSVRFWPFIRKAVRYNKEDIASIEIRTFRPILEFGGWGIRYSKKYGKAYTLQGSKGIQLIFKDGKKVLVGTSNPTLWEQAML
jgi:hypothetical protein